MADNSAALRALETREYATAAVVSSLSAAVKHNRWHSYSQRRSLQDRLRKAERQQRQLLSQITQLGEVGPFSLFSAKKQQISGGVTVRVEISLDGLSYSNPGPSIPHGAHVWVRAVIDEAHRGEAGYPITHEMCHVSWTYYSGYRARDKVPPGGEDDFFVSYPLTITREFTAPSGGSTSHDFFVYVDLYEPVNDPTGTSL